MSEATGGRADSRAEIIALVGACVGIYMLSQFFRNSIGVIGPDLARDFRLTATDLGLLTGVFFLVFSLAQIPLGVAIDRFGPKAAMLATAGLMVAGALVFASAGGFYTLLAGRALIGLGCSSFYMAPLAIYAERFRPERFSAMTGVQLGGGNFGTLIATAPLAYAAGAFGWRSAFFAIAAAGAVMTAIVFLAVREDRAAQARRGARRESLREALSGVVAATRVEGFWRVFFLQALTLAPFASILGLWGGPWLAQVYGLDVEARGRLLLVLATAQICGLFLWGASDRAMRSYRRPAAIGAALSAAILAAAAVSPMPSWMILPFFVAYGLASAIAPLTTAHGKALFPTPLVARGLTLMNIATIGGTFVLQALTGIVVDAFGAAETAAGRTYPEPAFRAVFALLAVLLLSALAFYLRAPDPHPLAKKAKSPKSSR